MFTGIVEELGSVRALRRKDRGYELVLQASIVLGGTQLGDSIAVNGVCLTVTEMSADSFAVGLSPETRTRTNLMELRPGRYVNLERAMTPTSRLGGHFVQGHVDAVGTVTGFRQDEDALWVTIKVPAELMRYIVPKGYITLDGTSLTVVEVGDDWFTVSLVAYTQLHIILPTRKVGDEINVEVDILGKYVEKMIAYQLNAPQKSESNISLDYLAEHGFG